MWEKEWWKERSPSHGTLQKVLGRSYLMRTAHVSETLLGERSLASAHVSETLLGERSLASAHVSETLLGERSLASRVVS